MENHGVIVWGKDVEDAYWKMENTDAYCQTVWIASQLGGSLHSIGGDKLKDLIALRKSLGMQDRREGLEGVRAVRQQRIPPRRRLPGLPRAEGGGAGGGTPIRRSRRSCSSSPIRFSSSSRRSRLPARQGFVSRQAGGSRIWFSSSGHIGVIRS